MYKVLLASYCQPAIISSMDNSTSQTNGPIEIGSDNATGQAKAVLNAHNRRSNNKHGRNQFSDDKTLTPYSMKFALADALLQEGRMVKDVVRLSGLCIETVTRIKKGERKVSQIWVDALKKNESAKHTFLSNTILDSISKSDIEKASLLQKVTSSSILIDKRRLLDGESTQNVSHLASLDNLSQLAMGLQKTRDALEMSNKDSSKDSST